MRSFNQAIETAETYSPAEERFNRQRRTVGLFLAPAVMAALWIAPLPIPEPAHRMAAIMGLVVVLWVSEALPMAVTALLGPLLAVVAGVADARGALAPFADPIIFLFIGSFILAEAMFVHGVDRRIAYTALSWKFVGQSAPRILLIYSAVATGLSMWISNTATTAMMVPIGLALVSLMQVGPRDDASRQAVRRFALGLMLMTSFGASVGGMATPVGTPPNLIGIGMLERITGARITFFNWMAIGVPLVLVLFAALVALFTVTTTRGVQMVEGGAALVRAEMRKLGRLSPAERNVLLAFGVTVLLWTLPGFVALAGLDGTGFSQWYQRAVPEGIAAMLGALLLFVLPVDWRKRRFTLTWDEAGAGLAGVSNRPRRCHRPRHHQLAAVPHHRGADRHLHGGGDSALGSHLQHRVGQHDRAGGDCRRPGGRRQAAGAGAGRDARRQHGLHDAHLHGAQRHRLQLGVHPDHGDDALRRRPRPHRVCGDRGRGPRARPGSVSLSHRGPAAGTGSRETVESCVLETEKAGRNCDRRQRERRAGRSGGAAGSACSAAFNATATPSSRRRASR